MRRFASLFGFIGKLPKWSILVLSALLVLVLGLLDYFTGEEISISIFYLLPVSLAAWYVSPNAGALLDIASAVTWFIADLTTGHVYANIAIPIWNAIVRLGFFLIVVFAIAFIKGAYTKEQDLARTDSLTGVVNTRYFYELATMEVERAKRYGRPFSVAYMDLDNFKEVNDVYGHSAGDELLCFIAGTIHGNIRKTDIVARLGGDEFILLLPESKNGEAGDVVEKLRTLILRGMPQYGFPVTLSIGLITYLAPPQSVEDMVREVDTLMYSVKNTTKNAIRQEMVESEEDHIRIAKYRPVEGEY